MKILSLMLPPIWLIDFGKIGCSIDFDWSLSPVCFTDDTFSIPPLDVPNEALPPIKEEEDVDVLLPPPPETLPPPLLLLL